MRLFLEKKVYSQLLVVAGIRSEAGAETSWKSGAGAETNSFGSATLPVDPYPNPWNRHI
jgi:hypothetical protein